MVDIPHTHSVRPGWEILALLVMAAVIVYLLMALFLGYLEWRRRRYLFPKMSLKNMEEWGVVLGCPRNDGESYEAYRDRLSAYVRNKR